jgi:hypothetical protein
VEDNLPRKSRLKFGASRAREDDCTSAAFEKMATHNSQFRVTHQVANLSRQKDETQDGGETQNRCERNSNRTERPGN